MICCLFCILLSVGFLAFFILKVDCDLGLFFLSKFKPVPEKAYGGQVIWLTGASSGIGEQLSYDFARLGASLVLSARRLEELNRVKEKCLTIGLSEDQIFVLPFDVTNIEQHKGLVQSVVDRFGKIDMLINNAGRSQRSIAIETDIEVTKSLVDLNLFSAVSLTTAVAPVMIKAGRGHFVVMSSVAGKVAAPVSSSYSAAKHAVQGYFSTLRLEIAPHNIDVTCICPGPVTSNITLHSAGSSLAEDAQRPPEKNKMDTERATELMVVGIYHKLSELWISKQPVLLFLYINWLSPGLATFLGRGIARKRMEALEKGEDTYKGLLTSIFKR